MRILKMNFYFSLSMFAIFIGSVSSEDQDKMESARLFQGIRIQTLNLLAIAFLLHFFINKYS